MQEIATRATKREAMIWEEEEVAGSSSPVLPEAEEEEGEEEEAEVPVGFVVGLLVGAVKKP